MVPLIIVAGVVGGKLEVYREHLICTPRFVVERGHKEVCIPPEGLSRFLSLIGSVPLDKQQMLPKHWDAGGRSQDLKFVSPYSVHHHRCGNRLCSQWIAVCSMYTCSSTSLKS